MAAAAPPHRLAVAVHGGAGALSDAAAAGAKAGCRRAAAAAMRVLLASGRALDAVEAAVRVLEDDERFNAGRGCVLTKVATVELDALVVEGTTYRAGAVTGSDCTANPVTLARRVMERSPHVLLAGAQACRTFAETQGLPLLPPGAPSLVTEARRKQLAVVLAQEAGAPIGTYVLPSSSSAPVPLAASAAIEAAPAPVPCAGDHDTVGCVAVDAWGGVAAATSTGGLCGKWQGRVGDTPIIGAGAFADDALGACSTTGTGEYIMRAMLARECCAAFESEARSGAADADADADAVAARVVHASLVRMRRRLGDPFGAGLVFVSPQGGLGVAHSSPRMSWATASAAASASAGTDAEPFLVRAGVQQLPLGGGDGDGEGPSTDGAGAGAPVTKARTPRAGLRTGDGGMVVDEVLVRAGEVVE